MARRVVLVAAGLCASIAAAPSARIARTAVHVTVEDQRGQPVTGIPAGAFSLTVDGVPRPIESAIAADQPLSVVLLVDDSLSMQPFAGSLDGPARAFNAGLDASDRWRVGRFADRILFSPAFAPGRSPFRLDLREPIALRDRTVGGGSPLWDALHQSVELLRDQPGRRNVLVFTDGRASGNHHGLEEVAESAVDHAVALTAIVPLRSFGVRQDPETVAMIRPAANLDRLARYTGGLLIGGYDFKGDPLKELPTLPPRLRAGYTLTFVMPDSDGRRHRLDVRVATPAVTVRAPMAFRAGP